jgi:hypothetical protein
MVVISGGHYSSDMSSELLGRSLEQLGVCAQPKFAKYLRDRDESTLWPTHVWKDALRQALRKISKEHGN